MLPRNGNLQQPKTSSYKLCGLRLLFPINTIRHHRGGTECESVCSCCGQLASTLIPKDAVSSLYDRLRAPADLATVCNTQSRCDELVDSMEEILATKKLTRCDGERRGRLQTRLEPDLWQTVQKLPPRIKLSRCQSLQNNHREVGLSPYSHVPNAENESTSPSLVDTNCLDWVHLYVDASYEQGGHWTRRSPLRFQRSLHWLLQ